MAFGTVTASTFCENFSYEVLYLSCLVPVRTDNRISIKFPKRYFPMNANKKIQYYQTILILATALLLWLPLSAGAFPQHGSGGGAGGRICEPKSATP